MEHKADVIIKKSKKNTFIALALALICLLLGPIGWFFSACSFLITLKLYLEYKYNYMILRENEVIIKTGFMGSNIKSIPYKKINNVDCHKIKEAITLYTGNDSTGIKFDRLVNSEEIQQKILSRINLTA